MKKKFLIIFTAVFFVMNIGIVTLIPLKTVNGESHKARQI